VTTIISFYAFGDNEFHPEWHVELASRVIRARAANALPLCINPIDDVVGAIGTTF